MVKIAVDFDGTLINEDDAGFYHVVPGAREAMEALKAQGFRIVIHTCRTGIAAEENRLAQEVSAIRQALEHFRIPFDEIYAGEKIVADFYVDDRAIPFTGDWHETTRQITRSAATLALDEGA